VSASINVSPIDPVSCQVYIANGVAGQVVYTTDPISVNNEVSTISLVDVLTVQANDQFEVFCSSGYIYTAGPGALTAILINSPN